MYVLSAGSRQPAQAIYSDLRQLRKRRYIRYKKSMIAYFGVNVCPNHRCVGGESTQLWGKLTKLEIICKRSFQSTTEKQEIWNWSPKEEKQKTVKTFQTWQIKTKYTLITQNSLNKFRSFEMKRSQPWRVRFVNEIGIRFSWDSQFKLNFFWQRQDGWWTELEKGSRQPQ